MGLERRGPQLVETNRLRSHCGEVPVAVVGRAAPQAQRLAQARRVAVHHELLEVVADHLTRPDAQLVAVRPRQDAVPAEGSAQPVNVGLDGGGGAGGRIALPHLVGEALGRHRTPAREERDEDGSLPPASECQRRSVVVGDLETSQDPPPHGAEGYISYPKAWRASSSPRRWASTLTVDGSTRPADPFGGALRRGDHGWIDGPGGSVGGRGLGLVDSLPKSDFRSGETGTRPAPERGDSDEQEEDLRRRLRAGCCR